MTRSALAALASADVLQHIAAYVRCPYALGAFLQLVPSADLSISFRHLARLAQTIALPHLWPRLRASALTSSTEVSLAATLLQHGSTTLCLDEWPKAGDRLAASAPALACTFLASMADAAAWTGARLVECALILASSDSVDDVASVAAWVVTAPRLRCVQLSYYSGLGPIEERLSQSIFSPRIVDISLHNVGPDVLPSHWIARLVDWLGGNRATRVSLAEVVTNDGPDVLVLARALHTCTSLRSLELTHLPELATAYLAAPVPSSLVELALTGHALPNGCAAALVSANLTRLKLHIHDAADDILAAVLASCPSMLSLTSIDVAYEALHERARGALVRTLPLVRALDELKLESLHGHDVALAAALVPVLPRCQCLHRVALRGLWWPHSTPPTLAVGSCLRYLCLKGCLLQGSTGSIGAVRVCCTTTNGPCWIDGNFDAYHMGTLDHCTSERASFL
ncbi:hypothetical protein SPRG_08980 [Saprolegnia parasitica CBS 223.65]|uniref:Uncharacterized protein n=1 Tax=Saprolegnia parasitica (strain CBS 223.65) TaxID=695850 RepID=A0A067CGP4_SAPPC|nr:hypothetical protein SPRG_08980 [Saprolegnia parasitica CBS 223.65]KDO25681.1 hypothetical protein SPRG_08980 [Saprolegnia parasitica CBS 223.65]|eukprot:XP_012203711.1 hypothetical protein SPRG_08980 [Saprolegnia parasitica CBS 223.65]